MRTKKKRGQTRSNGMSRRDFMGAAAATAAFTVVPRHVLGGRGRTAPSDKLNVACIGVGGMGASDVNKMSAENIVALCDVDWKHAAKTFEQHPNAKKYRDFRKMLDAEGDRIDAVTVSTPDNLHAVAAMAAIKRRKHVYCQKPLAHDIYEVRRLTEAAREYKVVTQMGIQIHAEPAVKRVAEIIKSGLLGKVRKVDIWSGKNWGGGTRPTESMPVPETLDWDLWLGPAPWRPYHKTYLPGQWRRWWDFGTGTLGDMGCHIIDPVFWALRLGEVDKIEVEATTTHFVPEIMNETYPVASIVRFKFPARGNMPAVELTWSDGRLRPPRPHDMEIERKIGGEGALLIGENGNIMHGSHGAGGLRIVPETKMKAYDLPAETIPRSQGHHKDWILAYKGGKPASANFNYGGPLTEMTLLGVLAIRNQNRKLIWDVKNMRVTNDTEADKFVNPPYRDGWTL